MTIHLPTQTVLSAASRASRALVPAIVMAMLLSAPLRAALSAVPLLESDTERASAGFFRLAWQHPEGGTLFELQESAQDDFSTPQLTYRGPDRARVLSGRDDGRYWFRVRAVDSDGNPGAWSAPLQVEVAHHSLFKAGVFFAVGALVFLSTLALIIAGHLRSREGQRIE